MKHALTLMLICLLMSGCAARGAGDSASGPGSDKIQLHMDMAESHIINRQPQLALQELLKVEGQASDTLRYQRDLGLIFMAMGELKKAHDAFTQAVKIDDNFGEAWNFLGRIHEALGQTQAAEAAYLKAFSILTYPTPEFPAYNLGNLYLQQGRPQDAEVYARKALARNWRFLAAYKQLADALAAQNRPADAEKALRDGLEAGVDNPALLLALAEHLTRTGKNSEARTLFERVIKQHPGSNEAKVARDYLDII